MDTTDDDNDEEVGDFNSNEFEPGHDYLACNASSYINSRRSLSPANIQNITNNHHIRKQALANKPIALHHVSKSPNNSHKQNSHKYNNSSRWATKPSKRPRFEHVVSRSIPVSRLVETLDKKSLETLINTLVQARPDLAHQIVSIAPTVTVSTALEALRDMLAQIYHGLPYKGEQDGDYAFLRVKHAIEDFLSALSDYTSHFLPPNEQQPSNSLAFLDAATMLLHRLPNWQSPQNNHLKQVAYDRIAEAWVITLKEASKKANGLGLAYGGWQQKLDQHNEMSHGLITPAVNCLKYELRWVNQDQQSASLFWGSNVSTYNHNNSPSTSNISNNNNHDTDNKPNDNAGSLFGQQSTVSINSWH